MTQDLRDMSDDQLDATIGQTLLLMERLQAERIRRWLASLRRSSSIMRNRKVIRARKKI